MQAGDCPDSSKGRTPAPGSGLAWVLTVPEQSQSPLELQVDRLCGVGAFAAIRNMQTGLKVMAKETGRETSWWRGGMLGAQQKELRHERTLRSRDAPVLPSYRLEPWALRGCGGTLGTDAGCELYPAPPLLGHRPLQVAKRRSLGTSRMPGAPADGPSVSPSSFSLSTCV